jgi:Rrf2 family nitric oxide-sensitive transcriptional repressor
MHLAAQPDRLASIGEMARTYRISQNHLMKVVHELRKQGFLESVRGRAGGVRLARRPEDITVGDVVRHAEGDSDLVDCESCIIASACSLTGVLREALAAFMQVLDGYSLQDLLSDRQRGLRELIASIEKVRSDGESKACREAH